MLYEITMERTMPRAPSVFDAPPTWLEADVVPQANAPETLWLLPLAEAALEEAPEAPTAGE